MSETFPLAVLTDSLEHLSLADAARWCAERGVAGLELGVGGYSPAPHLDRDRLVGTATARETLLRLLADAGLTLVALNASGNPLHPDPRVASAHEQALRNAITLAQQLCVSRVVAMSGCPGGPRLGPTSGPSLHGGSGSGRLAPGRADNNKTGDGDRPGSWPVFAGGAWLPDMEGLWPAQFEHSIAPFWRELSAWAARTAPDVRICLELHPGASIYNAESFARLREVTGENIAVNLDPSHFWWQGIDPVATIDQLGDAIGFAHGKDTLLHPDRIALHGVLDFRWPTAADAMPWHFCAVGAGRPVAEWSALLRALLMQGYHGPISIEHEDPNLDPQAGIEASITGLKAATDLLTGVAGSALQPPSGAAASRSEAPPAIHAKQRSA